MIVDKCSFQTSFLCERLFGLTQQFGKYLQPFLWVRGRNRNYQGQCEQEGLSVSRCKWISLNSSLGEGVSASEQVWTDPQWSHGTDRQTDRAENITFPQITYAGDKNSFHGYYLLHTFWHFFMLVENAMQEKSTMHQIYNQWWIQDFSGGGGNFKAGVLAYYFSHFFQKPHENGTERGRLP